MSSDGPSLPSACETVRRIAAGEQSPVEVIETALRRVEALSPALNALVTLSDTAMDQAPRPRGTAGQRGGGRPALRLAGGDQRCYPRTRPTPYLR